MFEKIRAAITDDNEISKEWQRFASLALLFLAVALAVIPRDRTGLPALNPFAKPLVLGPRLESTTIALALIAPLYLRGLLKWNKSPFTTISFVLILGVFASFVQMTIVGGGSITAGLNLYVLMTALALSWVGIRGIAGIAWIIVLVLGIYNFRSVSQDMDIWGYIYICSAFMGLCFHSGVNPGELLSSLKEEYSPILERVKTRVADDVTAAGKIYRP